MDDDSRRARLLSIKLTTLVREHTGVTDVQSSDSFGGGAALMVDSTAWVLLDRHPDRGLGGALAWAVRREATSVQVLAEEATGLLARRAAGFTMPICVWQVDGRSLKPAVALPLSPPEGVSAEHAELAADVMEAGAHPVVEHGVLAGEVVGLEVCRVVTDAYTGMVRLEVGVGAHDREAFQLLHGDRPTVEALTDVVRAVAKHRRPGAARHPLNLLAQERALRARLVAEPALINATEVREVAPPLKRGNVKDPVPCIATATIDGRVTAVVCSSGVDLDVMPYAIDARIMLGVERCLVVMPSRDVLGIQLQLAALANPPLTVAGVD